MIVDGGQQCLPPVGNHGAPFIGQVSTPPSAGTVPVQFVYAQSAYGQAVPVPVEVVQVNASCIFFTSTHITLHLTTVSKSSTTGILQHCKQR